MGRTRCARAGWGAVLPGQRGVFSERDGTPATAFNSTGKLLLDFAGDDDSASALALQTNGELVVAGSTTTSSGITSVALARLLAGANGSSRIPGRPAHASHTRK